MGIVNLTTNLKSLRYGKDRQGGGNTNQPYVKTPLPGNPNLPFDAQNDLSDIGRTGGPDFLLRGGTLLPNLVLRDASRLAKMFFDFRSPSGPLFIAKQNILSLSNVNSEAGYEVFKQQTRDRSGNFFQRLGSSISTFIKNNVALNLGIYTPLGTIASAATNPLGIHLNKQGLNPFKQTTKGSPDGNGVLGLPTYLNVIATPSNLGPKSRLLPLSANVYSSTNPSDGILYKYSGGPGATLGVGQTKIEIAKDSEGAYLRTTQDKSSLKFWGSGPKSTIPRQALTYVQLMDYEPVGQGGRIDDQINFQTKIAPTGSRQIPATIAWNLDKQFQQRVNLGDPGKKANLQSYSIGKRDGTNQLAESNDGTSVEPNSGYQYAVDKINAYPIYRSNAEGAPTNDPLKNDFVKFRIGAIKNDEPNVKDYVHFRASISNFSDSYTATWDATKFMGRAEEFYKYSGFGRTISVDWTIAAQSKQELIPMHQKMNYLASLCAPDYSKIGYMGGNLITLTIGGWCYEQTGIMTGISFSVPDESPWEISLPDAFVADISSDGANISTDKSVKELPMIVNVSGFQFIPIHDFVPRKQQNNYNGLRSGENGGKFISSYGREQYLGLKSGGDGSNYNGQANNINYIPQRPKVVPVNEIEPNGLVD